MREFVFCSQSNLVKPLFICSVMYFLFQLFVQYVTVSTPGKFFPEKSTLKKVPPGKKPTRKVPPWKKKPILVTQFIFHLYLITVQSQKFLILSHMDIVVCYSQLDLSRIFIDVYIIQNFLHLEYSRRFLIAMILLQALSCI